MTTLIEEYLTTTYEPDCDFVDGELVDRNAGLFPHSNLLTELIFYLHRFKPELRTFPIVRLRVSATRIRVADVAVIHLGSTIPLVCVEVLSGDESAVALGPKIDDYLNFGVRYVWVVDPETQRVWSYTTEGSTEIKDGILRTENPNMTVDLAEIFAELEP